MKLPSSRSRQLRPILCGSIFALCAAVLLSPAKAEPVFGLDTAGTAIRQFDSATPGTLGAAVPITGLAGGETLRGIDFRPATVRLYGVSSQNRLYVISLANGAAVATQVGAGGQFTQTGTASGVDFNPVPDRLRVVSDADQNLRLNPNDGTLVMADGTLAFAAGDPNAAANPNVVGAAYTNNFAGATTTTLYVVDSTLDILATQNPPNNGTLNTIGALGVNIGNAAGFDISGLSGTAFLTDGGTSFNTVNLTTGAATSAGALGAALSDIAVLPQTPFYWDINPAAAGLGGTGNWDSTTSPNWTFDPAGTGTNFPWPNTPTSDAIFDGTPGTVTVTDPTLQARNLTFNVSGYTIGRTGVNTLALTGSTITVTNLGNTATISVPLTGAATVTKAGAGTLILSGANTYTGGTVLNTGTLLANNNAALGASTGVLTINGGTFGSSVNGINLPNPVAVQNDFTIAVNGNLVLNGNIDLTGGTRVITGTDNQGQPRFNGVISNGGITFQTPFTTIGNYEAFIYGNSVANTYTGLTTVRNNAFLVFLGTAVNGAVVGDILVETNGVVDLLGSGDQIADTSTVTVNSAGNSAGGTVFQGLELFNKDETIRALNGGVGGTVGLGSGTLTVGAGNFAGSILDGFAGVTDPSDPAGGVGGNLIKNTPGTLVLSGTNTFTGATLISAGTLVLNGSLASPTVLVNPGAQLAGTGTAFGDVINSGTLSPGSPAKIGTFRIGSGFAQQPSGRLVIKIAGSGEGQYDRLAVAGTAELAGDLRLVKVKGARLKVGEKVTFLTAPGGVVGTFATVDNQFAENGNIFSTRLLYEGDAVSLIRDQRSLSALTGLTSNQMAVTKVLDRVARRDQPNALIDFINREPVGNLRGDFDRIAPEELTSMFHLSRALSDVQTANLQQRLVNLRAGTTGFSAAGLNLSGGANDGNGFGGVTGVEGAGGKMVTPVGDPRFGAFVTGSGEFTNIDDTGNARGFDLTTGGFTIGVDYRVAPGFAVGVNAGYARTGIDLNSDGRITVDGAKFGAYATYWNEGFYADAAVNGGYNSYSTRRGGLGGDARGDTDGGEVNVLVAIGFDWVSDAGFSFGPTASFQFTSVSVGGFRENGSLAPLNVEDESGDSRRVALGFRASYDWKIGTVLVRPELRAAWQQEFGETSYSIDSSLARDGGGSFSVDGPKVGRNSLLLGTGVAVQWDPRTAAYLYYDGDLARANQQTHSITGGVRISF